MCTTVTKDTRRRKKKTDLLVSLDLFPYHQINLTEVSYVSVNPIWSDTDAGKRRKKGKEKKNWKD